MIERCVDKEALRAFILAHDDDFVPPMSQQVEDMDGYIADLFATGGFFVKKEHGTIIGAVAFRHSDPRHGMPYVSYLAVAKDRRRQGIGQALMEHCLDILKDSGEKVILRTWSTNEAALGLYKKLGFHHDRVVEHDRGQGIHTIYLVKELG